MKVTTRVSSPKPRALVMTPFHRALAGPSASGMPEARSRASSV
jgi:hypothetical protein